MGRRRDAVFGAACETSVWSLRVPAAQEADALDLSVLDAEELQRMTAFKCAVDRLRYGFAHIALRQILAMHLGTEPHAVKFRREPCPVCGGPHGRPAVDTPRGGMEFSLSHGGRFVLIAIAGLTVGADVVCIPSNAIAADVARALHPAERVAVQAAAPAHRGAAFARVWARKEAYLKGLGTGLGRDLAKDDTGAALPGWQIIDLPVDAGHVAALAVCSPRRQMISVHRALPEWC